ncbi:DUF3617 family protein [Siculibacillus lacustris]|uniref:DUF3617 family protein n=1 Tax=Siculibacillus lacustris TaxID=1549641 RepID=A0A4Q9VQX6_9HYPH|nr:DUF3617 family protein [Siculibacillus lacustris]TBW38245.1 DUF3617 family protein [Siculibacillus lacustris]
MKRVAVSVAVVVLSASAGWADDVVLPQQKPGLWEVRSTTPSIRTERWATPEFRSTYRYCRSPAGRPAEMSKEMSDAVAKLGSCSTATVTRSGTDYVTTADCRTPRELFQSRAVYSGDFRSQLTIRSYHVTDGKTVLVNVETERRIGECPATK